MHQSQAIIRTAYRFIKAKLPGLSTLTFEITTQTEDFIQDQDFLHYWRHVVPNERIAFLKGFIEGRKVNEHGTNQGNLEAKLFK